MDCKYIFYLLLIILLINPSSASVVYQESYHNHNGELVTKINGGNDWFGITDNGTHFLVDRMGDNLNLSKSFGTYTFNKDKISWSFISTPTQLESRSTKFNDTLWWISVPKPKEERWIFFDNNIKIYNDLGNQLDPINYKFSYEQDEIRLWYNSAARTWVQSSLLITFESNSYYAYDNTSLWAGINFSTDNNITIHRENGTIELQDAVPDYVSKWRFDNVSTIYAKDENFTNSNTGVWNGNATANMTYGKYLNALLFDGSNDYVDAGNDESLNITNAITIEAWIKATGIDTYDVVLGKTTSGGDNGYDLILSSGKIRLELNTGVDVTGTTDLRDNIWHHVVGSYNGTVSAVYVDGVLEKELTQTWTPQPSNNVLSIAARNGFSLFFNGSIDDVRIYNRPLSYNEINLTYNNSHKINGSITTNITDAGLSQVNAYFNFTGIDHGNNVTYELQVNGSSDNITFTGWKTVSTALNINSNTTIPTHYEYRYTQFRLLENTSYISETDEIEQISIQSAFPRPVIYFTSPIINNCTMRVHTNLTNLAPGFGGDYLGTGDRINATTYWTNDSTIEVWVQAHASSASQTAEIILYVNGTAVQRTSGRPLGGAEESWKAVSAIIDKGSNYSVVFFDYHHYEWRESKTDLDISGCNYPDDNDSLNSVIMTFSFAIGFMIAIIACCLIFNKKMSEHEEKYHRGK